MREGSITLGLLIGLTLGSLAVGGGAGWYATKTALGARHAAELDALAQDHQREQDALQGRVEALVGDLATCEAKTTPEAITATGRVLEAAQASDIADVQLRAAVVGAIPSTLLAQAVIDTGSSQSIAAYAALSGCWSSNTTGDSARSGCSTVIPQAWGAAVAGLAACPEAAAELGAGVE
ncbi:hypothetical protein H8E07_13410 [bacterium]|nr:hypothetical protein [bacterium]